MPENERKAQEGPAALNMADPQGAKNSGPGNHQESEQEEPQEGPFSPRQLNHFFATLFEKGWPGPTTPILWHRK